MKNPHLLLVTIGPVQDFIAQARRTRDLWFGSHALSELARAAARSLADQGARLVFPALDRGHAELRECDEPIREDGQPPLSIANKILAEVGHEPEALADAARKAVMERWDRIAARVKKKFKECLAPDIDYIWNEQIGEIIEFYATWAPLSGGSDGYGQARAAVERALAGRKMLRDFVPWQHDRKGAPKSSLDGARVSVLDDNRNRGAFSRLRISTGEQLDAVGLVKRGGFSPEQFVPLMNIAAAPWLIDARNKCPDRLDELAQECERIGLNRITRELPVIADFAHDASVFYRDRWRSLLEELGTKEDPRNWGGKHIEPILKLNGSPSSYVACLVADGDRMGKTLDALAEAETHRQFSHALSEFPKRARDIVESKQHLGALIYAGGDDVLAFMPVATAIGCAHELKTAFEKIMGGALTNKEALGGKSVELPTLSVGIGVGHVLDAMGDLLDLGRTAEKAAKKAGRNALAIVFDKRSGGRREWAARWDTDPVRRIIEDAELLGDTLATGKIYQIGAFLRRFKTLSETETTNVKPEMLDAYVEAILKQSGNRGTTVTVATLISATTNSSDGFVARLTEMQRTTDRLLIAKELRNNGLGQPGVGAAP